MRTYIPFFEGRPYLPKRNVNPRGFYENEIKNMLKNNHLIFDRIICVEEEVAKYDLLQSNNNDLGLDEEVYFFQLWYKAFNDKVLNDFSIPIRVKKSDRYMEELKKH